MVGVRTAGIALFNRSRNIFAHGTVPVAIGILPSQAILLAGSTDDPLGILAYIVKCALLSGVIVLRFHVTVTDINGIQFIGANAAIQKFLPTSFAVEEPFLPPLHQWYGERPVLVAH